MESGHQIATSNTAYFRHGYDCEHADIRRLYEQAKIGQWAGPQHAQGRRVDHPRYPRSRKRSGFRSLPADDLPRCRGFEKGSI